jgi:hypothetical protein
MGNQLPLAASGRFCHMVAEDPHISDLLWLGNPYFQLGDTVLFPSNQ